MTSHQRLKGSAKGIFPPVFDGGIASRISSIKVAGSAANECSPQAARQLTSSLLTGRVIVRERWPLVRVCFVLVEQAHHYLDCFLELRIVALAPKLGIQLDFEVRLNAVILHFTNEMAGSGGAAAMPCRGSSG